MTDDRHWNSFALLGRAAVMEGNSWPITRRHVVWKQVGRHRGDENLDAGRGEAGG